VPKFVSPIGAMVFGSIVEPRENPNSGKVEWNLGFVLGLEESNTIMENIATAVAAKRAANPKFPQTDDKLKFPYRPSIRRNEEGEKEPDPDSLLWNFKRNATYQTKTGEIKQNNPPALYDSLGRLVTGTIDRVPSGTTGKVVYDIYVYDMPGAKGVSLQIVGFQIAEMKKIETDLAPIEGGWVPDEIDDIAAALAADA
jgi:hypothetical protein